MNCYKSPLFIINAFAIILTIGCQSGQSTSAAEQTTPETVNASLETSPGQLRHLVLFKFKEDADPADIKKVGEGFAALQEKIPAIQDFEWGLNDSPSGMNKGFTHCYLITFNGKEGLAEYLPHPDHHAFSSSLDGLVVDKLIIDYLVN
ncbi:MAG: hypothetical protein DHS20C17_21130 [Cyclobacteriaceae bacterium]|nr:MAG: hypothetical protein DHS20C17_21130 [Cyclobacteriaceae bacterium]